MKRLFSFLLALALTPFCLHAGDLTFPEAAPAVSTAMFQQIPTYQIRYGAATPAVCNPATGDVFILTAGVTGLYRCTAANTWTLISSSGTANIFLAGDGLVGAPAYSFGAEPTSGFYRSAAGTVSFASLGVATTDIGAQFGQQSNANNMVLFSLTGATNIFRIRRVDTGPSFFRFHNTADTGTTDTDGFSLGLDAAGGMTLMNWENADVYVGNNGGVTWTFGAQGDLTSAGVAFANLPGAPVNGMIIYCTDCTIANPCAAAGTGAIAKRLNAVWVCN